MDKNTTSNKRASIMQGKILGHNPHFDLFLLLTVDLIYRSMALCLYCRKIFLLEASGKVSGSQESSHKVDGARVCWGLVFAAS